MKMLLAIFLLVCCLEATARAAETGSQRRRREAEVVAAVLVAEAGGERDRRAMECVFEVVRNRAKANRLTEYQVVMQPKQFSCLKSVTNVAAFVASCRSHPKFDEAFKIVRSRKKTNYCHNALFYHRDNQLPSWAVGQPVVAWIGHHKFYRALEDK